MSFEERLENDLGQKGEPHFYKMKQISYLFVVGSFFQMRFVSVVTVSSWAERRVTFLSVRQREGLATPVFLFLLLDES